MARKIKPVSRVIRMESEIHRMAGEVFFRKKGPMEWEETWVPCVDISEKTGAITVEVELPGVDQDDISIKLHSNRIEIRGFKKETQATGNIKYHRLEREFGAFSRLIYLPSIVLTEGAMATFENGILTIVLKKYSKRRDNEVELKIDDSTE